MPELARKLLAFVAIVSFNLIPAAQAQETGTLIKRPLAQMGQVGKGAAGQTLRQFATCVASRSPGKTDRFLATLVNVPGYEKLGRSLATDECLSLGQLIVPSSLFRGALFGAVYLRDFDRDGPTDFTSVPPYDYRSPYGAEPSPDGLAAVALSRFGDCIVRSNGSAAKGIVLSLPGSQTEASSIRSILPVLSKCVRKGETVSVSKSVLRAAGSEGLYRLSRAASLRIES